MQQPKRTNKTVPEQTVAILRRRRRLRWIDSLMWLAIAGVLAALLVPAKFEQVAGKQPSRSKASAVPDASLPTPIQDIGDRRLVPLPEFILENEADYIHAQTAPKPSSPESTPTTVQEGGSIKEDSPRVTTGPTLNGPHLGSPR
jgi:hypothetical protein